MNIAGVETEWARAHKKWLLQKQIEKTAKYNFEPKTSLTTHDSSCMPPLSANANVCN